MKFLRLLFGLLLLSLAIVLFGAYAARIIHYVQQNPQVVPEASGPVKTANIAKLLFMPLPDNKPIDLQLVYYASVLLGVLGAFTLRVFGAFCILVGTGFLLAFGTIVAHGSLVGPLPTSSVGILQAIGTSAGQGAIMLAMGMSAMIFGVGITRLGAGKKLPARRSPVGAAGGTGRPPLGPPRKQIGPPKRGLAPGRGPIGRTGTGGGEGQDAYEGDSDLSSDDESNTEARGTAPRTPGRTSIGGSAFGAKGPNPAGLFSPVLAIAGIGLLTGFWFMNKEWSNARCGALVLGAAWCGLWALLLGLSGLGKRRSRRGLAGIGMLLGLAGLGAASALLFMESMP